MALNTDNDRLGIMGLFPIPTASLTAADIQQFILYRDPLAVIIGGRSITSVVHGGGNLTTSLTFRKLLQAVISGNGSLTDTVLTHRILSSVINAGGVLISNIHKHVPYTSKVQGNGAQIALIAKAMQSSSIITGNGAIATTFNIMKSAISQVKGNTSGLIVNVKKGTAFVSSVSGNGSLIDSILINKQLGTITISGGGAINTVYIRDFKDNSIIFINLDVIAENTNGIYTTILGNNTKEFNVYGSF